MAKIIIKRGKKDTEMKMEGNASDLIAMYEALTKNLVEIYIDKGVQLVDMYKLLNKIVDDAFEDVKSE